MHFPARKETWLILKIFIYGVPSKRQHTQKVDGRQQKRKKNYHRTLYCKLYLVKISEILETADIMESYPETVTIEKCFTFLTIPNAVCPFLFKLATARESYRGLHLYKVRAIYAKLKALKNTFP
ncbi:hypothetical protein CEXT_700741 [Caerostris extrusa]|uniref:Uncharacterized protein n=1 Tax=Caerostris extrusa TaxID=172846 RepID=A0AAV4PW45_CAEEX|nr:hypothetical protein CEXT_700741 [Caerostris extrusa]